MKPILLTFALLLVSSEIFAHDFWIEPVTFRPAKGEVVGLGLRVGVEFAGDAVGRSAQLIETFVVRDARGERPIGGVEHRDPAGVVRFEGPAVVAYRSKANPLELTGEKFEQFLREEGFESMIAARAKRGESKQPSRERFYRFAKTILGAPVDDPVAAKPFGLRFEIVPDRDGFRVLHEGKPVANILVMALHRDDPRLRPRARSDRNGRVKLDVSQRGVWLVKAVNLVPAGAEWESLWASLTFER